MERDRTFWARRATRDRKRLVVQNNGILIYTCIWFLKINISEAWPTQLLLFIKGFPCWKSWIKVTGSNLGIVESIKTYKSQSEETLNCKRGRTSDIWCNDMKVFIYKDVEFKYHMIWKLYENIFDCQGTRNSFQIVFNCISNSRSQQIAHSQHHYRQNKFLVDYYKFLSFEDDIHLCCEQKWWWPKVYPNLKGVRYSPCPIYMVNLQCSVRVISILRKLR